MNENEVRTVASICLTADGGCSSCARGLIQDLGRAFPEHKDAVRLVYVEKFGADSWGEIGRWDEWHPDGES